MSVLISPSKSLNSLHWVTNIWVCFWLICRRNITKDMTPIYIIACLCISSCSINKKIAYCCCCFFFPNVGKLKWKEKRNHIAHSSFRMYCWKHTLFLGLNPIFCLCNLPALPEEGHSDMKSSSASLLLVCLLISATSSLSTGGESGFELGTTSLTSPSLCTIWTILQMKHK